MVKSVTNIHYYDFGIFRLDVTNCELLKDGEHIALTQKSFEILSFLIQNRGRMLKKEEILNIIWTESFVEEANLAQHIYMIRKVLKDNGDDYNYIETIPKYGYRFSGNVTENTVNSLSLLKNIPSTNIDSQSNEFEKDNSNENHNGLVKNQDKNSFEETTKLIKTPHKTNPTKRSLLIPNILFATVFSIIIFAFIYIAYFSKIEGNSDISTIKSISILPFKQIGEGGNGQDEKLGLGLADTLISRLGNQNQISISPTATIAKFTDDDSENLLEIGESLNVDAILTGTIQRENNSVRVNVQLISVRNKAPLWTDKFDVEFSDIFTLQDRISEELAQKLSLKLNDVPQLASKTKYKPNEEALEEYNKGFNYWDNRSSDNLPKAIKHFENAIAKDDKFALAYSHLADSYSLIGFYKLTKIMPFKEALEKAKELANKAIELDPESSVAYTALALVAFSENDPDESIKLYKQAIRLNPDNSIAHLRLAWLLTTEDNLDDAIKQMRLAQKAAPESQMINTNLARLLRLNRQTDEALDYCKKAVEIDPSKTMSRVILAEIYEQKGLLDKSIEELKSVPKNAPEEKTAKLLLSRVFAKKGNEKEARKMLHDANNVKSQETTPSYEVATIYAHLGEKEAAVKKLQKAKDDDSLIYFLHLKYDYNVDSLRNSPEYSKILTQSKNKVTKVNDKKS